jgi:hypothetical protein
MIAYTPVYNTIHSSVLQNVLYAVQCVPLSKSFFKVTPRSLREELEAVKEMKMVSRPNSELCTSDVPGKEIKGKEEEVK